MFIRYGFCHSVPEPKRFQRIYGGLGAVDVFPLLPVVVE